MLNAQEDTSHVQMPTARASPTPLQPGLHGGILMGRAGTRAPSQTSNRSNRSVAQIIDEARQAAETNVPDEQQDDGTGWCQLCTVFLEDYTHSTCCTQCNRTICAECCYPLRIDQCFQCQAEQIGTHRRQTQPSESSVPSVPLPTNVSHGNVNQNVSHGNVNHGGGLTSTALHDAITRITGANNSDPNAWAYRQLQMQDATRVQVSHTTARPNHSPHSNFTPTHEWQPPDPNQLPADFLNPNYTHTGMPPAMNFRGPMDAPIAS
jgi:hypothetical protein